MKYKKVIPFILYTITTLLGYIIVFPEKVGVCTFVNNLNCDYSFPVFTLGRPLLFFSVYASIVSFIMIFTNTTLFVRWLKVSTVWTVASFFILRILPVYDQQALPIFSFTRGDTARTCGKIFVIITIIVVVHYWWHKRTLNKISNKKTLN